MKEIIFSLFLFFSNTYLVYSQQETNIWYFGTNAGITFATNPPTALTNGALSTGEGCATICDATGNLLFYTDGVTVYNKTHLMMDNGFGLHGNISSTQSAIILPRPGSTNIYYIFTTDVENMNNYGLQYSVVDISMNGGLGKVISKNTLIIQPTSEKVTVVKHSNNTSFWVVTHGVFNNNFYSFLVTSAGINMIPVISSVGSYQNSGLKLIGYLKTSFDNQKLASAKNDGGELELFDYDNTTGTVSNPILLSSSEEFYGVEFSPDNSKLYASVVSPSIIYQFDLNAANIAASKNAINYGPLGGGALQMGKNEKIYYIEWFNDSLSVINNPNSFNCNFVSNAVYLDGKNGRIGLPNFVPSLIISNCKPNACISISDTTICQGKQLQISNITSQPYIALKWLQNGIVFDTINTINKTFNTAGTYIISLIVYNDTCKDTANITVTVTQPIQTMLNPSICEGESFAVGIHNYSLTGNYSDTLFSNNGCDSIILTNLTVNPYPIINLGNDTSICDGSSIILNAIYPNATYLWQDNSTNPIFIVTQPGLYMVKVSTDSCSSMDSINIVFRDCEIKLELPNIITPNNDGSNDLFLPLQSKNIEKINTQLFNRWGNLIFETDNLQIEWDGKSKGQLVADGVYFWIVNYTDVNGKVEMMKGSVTVMK
jgi:gliding motility-associated-like protein